MTSTPDTGSSAMDMVVVPYEWKRLGFSGLFHTVASVEEADRQAWRERVPCRLPLGTNGDWLALEVVEDGVLVVRNDASAVLDITLARGSGDSS